MDVWSTILALLTLRFEQLGVALMHVPVGLIIAALIFPILLTALASHPIPFLTVALLIAAIWAIDVTWPCKALSRTAAVKKSESTRQYDRLLWNSRLTR